MIEISADAAKLAGLQIDLLQKMRSEKRQITIEHLEWFVKLTKEERDRLSGSAIITTDSRFKLLKSFELTVPATYDHSTQLASFRGNHRKDFYYYNVAIVDENFAKVTNKLVPGRTYTVKIFGINQSVSSEDCLAFLETQNAMLVGAQGISLVWEYRKEEFPISKYTLSFDKKDALWKVAVGDLRMPFVVLRPRPLRA